MFKRIILTACIGAAVIGIPVSAHHHNHDAVQDSELSVPQALAQTTSLASLVAKPGPGLPHFYTVTPDYQLLRGGQPSGQGLQQLKRAGVKTIINLRQIDSSVEREEALAHELGMHFVSIPMNSFDKATPSDIRKFLDTVGQSENLPAFVHCRLGEDRTGTMVAIYRIDKEGWQPDRAYSEMLNRGFHPFLIGLSNSVFDYGESKGLRCNRPGICKLKDLFATKRS